MAEIYINFNTVQDLIFSFGTVDSSFVVKNLTNLGNRYQCNFILQKKEGKIDIYVKKGGTCNILPIGNNREISNILIDYISKHGFINSKNNQQIIIKKIDFSLDNLIEFISEQYNSMIQVDIKNKTTELTGFNNDKVYLTYHENKTLHIQGKPLGTFALIIEFLIYNQNIDLDDLISYTNQMDENKLNISKQTIEQELINKLGKVKYYLEDPIIKTIAASLIIQKTIIRLPDYSSFLHGVFRGLEGYLKKILFIELTYKFDKNNKFYMFNRNDKNYIMNNSLVSSEKASCLEMLYDLYKSERNAYFHASHFGAQTVIIAEAQEAIELSNEILDKMKSSYSVLVED